MSAETKNAVSKGRRRSRHSHPLATREAQEDPAGPFSDRGKDQLRGHAERWSHKRRGSGTTQRSTGCRKGCARRGQGVEPAPPAVRLRRSLPGWCASSAARSATGPPRMRGVPLRKRLQIAEARRAWRRLTRDGPRTCGPASDETSRRRHAFDAHESRTGETALDADPLLPIRAAHGGDDDGKLVHGQIVARVSSVRIVGTTDFAFACVARPRQPAVSIRG